MKEQISQVRFPEVEPLKLAAARDSIPIRDTQKTDWFVLSLDGEVVACAGVYWMSKAARLKAMWTTPEWRGQGLGIKLAEACIAHVEEKRPGTAVEIYSRRPETFERLGFEIVPGRKSPGGSVMLRKHGRK